MLTTGLTRWRPFDLNCKVEQFVHLLTAKYWLTEAGDDNVFLNRSRHRRMPRRPTPIVDHGTRVD